MAQNPKIDFFDKNFYVKAYRDINPRFVIPLHHYQKYGINENRLPNATFFHCLYPLFNINIYASSNSDLSHLSQEELMSHFHHIGRFECRTYK